MNPAFLEACRTNQVVRRGMDCGLSHTEIIVWLVKANEELTEELLRVSMLTPKVYRDSNGALMRWDCPTKFIPVEQLPNPFLPVEGGTEP